MKRTEVIRLTVTPEEKRKIKELAANSHAAVATFVRIFLMETYQKQQNIHDQKS